MRWLVALVLITLVLAGCTDSGTDRDMEEAPTANGNVWERGLADFYEAPPHARTANATERRADLAPPGDPGFAQFDATMQNFIDQYAIPAAQLGVMHNGQLIYTSGYGYTNMDGTGPTDESTMFRMASVTKPITRALITLQVEEGLYEWTDPVFCIPPDAPDDCRLPIEPHQDLPVIDDRIADITVQDLVDHAGGWGGTMNHLYRPEGTEEMRAILGFDGAPNAWQTAQYMMGKELQDTPGTTFSYCNVCYMLAGLIAEAATGVEYNALLDAYFLRPLDLSGDLEISKALPEERNPREPFYHDDDMTPSVYDPNETVRQPDGGVNFNILFTAGGLTGTTEAIATIYGAYPDAVPPRATRWLEGQDAWAATHERYGHTGLLDGTSAMSIWAADRHGGAGTIQYVVLFNDAGPGSGDCEGRFSVDLPTGGNAGSDSRVCPMQPLQEHLMSLSVEKALERSGP